MPGRWVATPCQEVCMGGGGCTRPGGRHAMTGVRCRRLPLHTGRPLREEAVATGWQITKPHWGAAAPGRKSSPGIIIGGQELSEAVKEEGRKSTQKKKRRRTGRADELQLERPTPPAPWKVLQAKYRIGQLYMISKHSHEQSDRGEGVEVVQNEPYEDPTHGNGQYTEKRVYLNSKLPSWARAVVPRIFYVTEKAWNYYPYTITEYTCSFLPKFFIHIETKYEDNNGSNDNDLRYFKSEKTQRGMLKEGWRETQKPIMCSYKLVTVKFEVWGLQTRVEQFVLKVIRDILMIGHRQAFAWVDEWYDMTMNEVREFERATQEATNKKIGIIPPAITISNIVMPSLARSGPSSAPTTPLASEAPEFLAIPKDRPRKKSAPETLTLPDSQEKHRAAMVPDIEASGEPSEPKHN
ncbi:cytoplasmic phosphatidylinositol transfer protein 1 [Rhincodon typus]|uniref:cytoplasmic phosphatidylinositol transfer protein 1 n=1 Tax=Rhincodon typus TaxID=259920 RepID=UPI0020308735|nr:cytoplasmic phosphatidylinositol transfer protein 1 [Rhincodon typus]